MAARANQRSRPATAQPRLLGAFCVPTPHHTAPRCTPRIAMATEADAVPEGQLHAAADPDTAADSAQKQPVKRSWR